MSDTVEYVSEFMGGNAPRTPRQWTDAEKDRARRASDIINEHIAGLDWETLKQCWMAFRLSDGSSDGNLYDSKQLAVQHQLHEQQCVYIALKNLVNGATPNELLRFFRFNEDAYNAGMRLPDPDALDGGPDLAPTSGQMDYYAGRVRPNA